MIHPSQSPTLSIELIHSLPSFSGGRYSAACRSCGTRLRLTDEDLQLSLDEAPICWPCDTRDAPLR